MAVWQTGPYGLQWLDDLVATGHVVSLGGIGYPTCYTAHAAVLVPPILKSPPMAYESWVLERGSVVLPGWPGKTVIDPAVIEACRPEEWLLVVAWDES